MAGKRIDFFLEDDMFELEGIVKKENNRFFVEITGAIQHIIKMTGRTLEIILDQEKMYLRKPDAKEKYEIFINRIYESVANPGKEALYAFVEQGIHEFLKKSDNTYVLYNDSKNTWSIRFFHDHMPNGATENYKTLEELYNNNSKIMPGQWDAVYYNCEWE